MLGINYLKRCKQAYLNWKKFQEQAESVKARGFLSSQTYMKYPKLSHFNGKKVLNLGCGSTTYPASNVINLDGWEGEGINIVHDLSKIPLPFKDQEFDFIIANHVIEHIPNWFECFKELARILKVGGKMEIWCPPVSSDSAFTYRDHINWIGTESFMGCQNTGSRSHNLWATTQDKIDHVKNLRMEAKFANPAQFLWLIFLPTSLLRWCMEHLRNCVSESGYIFKKLSHD